MNVRADVTRVVTPTIETLVRYAGASGDFYPIHYDEAAAAHAGLDDLPVHGLLKMAWLVDAAIEVAGPTARLITVECRYSGLDYRATPMTVHAAETSRSGGRLRVAMWSTNAVGITTTTAAATFDVPRRVEASN